MAEKRILTAAYCRLSRPNEDSIENQETIIRNYIRAHKNEGFDYLQAYVDDGRTGTNFNRPGWEQLMKDCESGLVKCIIVKDLSRLGRQLTETQALLEETLPDMGVRFISITENYDSDKDTESKRLETAFTNLANAHYPTEASEKIHDSLNKKMTHGEWVGRVPYGYMKTGPHRERIDKDPETATWVEKIFERYLDGKRIVEIIDLLESHGVATPTGKHERWSYVAVKNLLNNEVYCGVFRQHKEYRKLYKKTAVPEELQVYIEDHHTAIIDRNTYQKVQEKLKERSRAKPLETKGDKGNPWNWIIYLKEAPDDGMYKYEKTSAITEKSADGGNFVIGFRCDYWSGGEYRIRNAKVEKGSKATEWCSAQ